MSQTFFTDEDIAQIESVGLNIDDIFEQIRIFKNGAFPVILDRPCTVGDGINTLNAAEIKEIVDIYDNECKKGSRVLKFVPASGAATRMFKAWYSYLEIGALPKEYEREFAENIKKYPFWKEIKHTFNLRGKSLDNYLRERKYLDILNHILVNDGLNYGALPKGLIKFHVYSDGSCRSAIEEHLVESILYAQDKEKACRLHFTVSKEHYNNIIEHILSVKDQYESIYDVKFYIDISIQSPSTNTIALDMENLPFRDIHGRLVFRPGGHGALLENLNNIDGDIIFIKNIDNVVPDRLKALTVLYKKILGGCLVKIQREIFKYLHIIESNKIDKDSIKEIEKFCEEQLNIVLPERFKKLPQLEKKEFLFDKLNRPIRVCGMVKNEGEPGGGPFWVRQTGDEEMVSMQIVEESQITDDESQKAIWMRATHFNPVDLVCGVRDYRSNKFDLKKYVDRGTYLISKKTEKGKELKALEYPGLWNGSMAYWNTIFVEVPIETFNPVKTVDDLLRAQHLQII